ncbi:MAG TPA: 50S ribosomal protein L10 [Gemmataceae bacterium]|jgi:large subunit ribosomal protein L10|nr:50S ribosomal protein L10 [Gemmataceae bacterium]
MSKLIKQMEIAAMKKTFEGVRDLVMMKVVGLNAIADNQVRLGLRKKGIHLQMVKNSLARRVFTDMGIAIDAGWDGSTTVAWGGTSIAGLSKEIEALAKKHDKLIKVKTAVADGQEVPFELALKMPTREEAIGRVIGLALAPASRLVGQILGPAASVASQIKSISEKKEEDAPAATA